MEVEGSLEPDESYDLFCACYIDEGSNRVRDPLTITLNGELSTTIAGFKNLEIKPGYRYWFDLTVTADGKLMQTSMVPPYAWYTLNPDATEFTLTTAGQLRELAGLVNGEADALAAVGADADAVSFAGKTVRLGADIDLQSEEWTQGIGISSSKPFKGVFDGGGYHISGLKVNATGNNAGLFGYVSGGTVCNLRVSGTVTTSGSYVGGITGYLAGGGTVENCLFSGTVSGQGYASGIAGLAGSNCRIARCHTRGSVTATASQAGGIAGQVSLSSNIEDCYSQAAVESTDKYAGGIAGYNSGTITRCYATGAISGTQYVGGISGSNAKTIENCIALNPSLTRTGDGASKAFGRITGSSSYEASVTNCAAFQGMTITVANGSSFNGGGKHGDDLTNAECLTADAYTSRGFTAAYGWTSHSGATWTYLPWNPAFKSFSGINPEDYRIKASVIN